MDRRFLLLFLALALCLAGCSAGRPSAYDGVSSTYPAITEQIARDAAGLLAGVYPPGKTRLAVDARSAFGRDLENALRQRGFMLSESGIPIRYQLDLLHDEDPPACYLSLRLPEGTLTQTYSLNGGVVVADAVAKTGLSDFSQVPETMSAQLLPPSTPLGYAIETDALPSGVTRNVLFAVKKDGLPVGANVRLRFEENPAYPNLRTIERVTDENSQITVRGLQIADSSVPLRATVNGQPGIACAMLPASPALPPPAQNPPNVDAALASPRPGSSNSAPALVPSSLAPSASAAPVASSLPVNSSVPITPLTLPSGPAAASHALLGVPAQAPLSASAFEDAWHVRPGLLREQVEHWAQRAGYQLVWNSSSDYELHSAAVFRGTFINAVERLFTRLHMHGNPLRAAIYESNQVLEVNED